MNVVILGNAKQTNVSDTIKSVASIFVEAGINVRYPAGEDLDTSEDLSFQETYARIDWADVVMAIPRDGLSFEHSIMGQVAYAKHVKKPVFVYYG